MLKLILPTLFQESKVAGVTVFQNLLLSMSHVNGVELLDLTGAPLKCIQLTNSPGWVSLYKRKVMHAYYLLCFNSAFPKHHPVFFQTSLNQKAIIRDVAYMKKCMRSNRKFAVFIHGWNADFAKWIDATSFHKNLADCFNHAVQIWVLANDYKALLIKWGVRPAIIQLETTMVDDDLVQNANLSHKSQQQTGPALTVLFMSRLVKEKGIFETLAAFRLHLMTCPDSRLIIAGDGPDEAVLRRYVNDHAVPNYEFVGYVSGKEKSDLLTIADVLILPTQHGEGLPIALLEAMAFGCVILTRCVGGLKDMFINGKMGLMTDSQEPTVFVDYLNQLCKHPERITAIRTFNQQYARNHVMASIVCNRIFERLKTTLDL